MCLFLHLVRVHLHYFEIKLVLNSVLAKNKDRDLY